MAAGPCLNPNCKSHGQPHPNCRCYGPGGPAAEHGSMAEGGEVQMSHFCDSKSAHQVGCEYYADGGGIGNDMPAGFQLAPIPSIQMDQNTPSAPQAGSDDMPPGFQVQAPAEGSDEIPEGFQLQSEKYGTVGQMAKTAVEGASQGVMGPLAPYIETKLGIATPEDIRGRAEENPLTHGGAETAAFVGSMLTGAGEVGLGLKGAALLPKAVMAAEKTAVAAAKLAGIENKIAKGAAAASAGMALYAASDEATKAVLGDPNQTAQSAVSHIGLSAVLGGGFGAGTAALSPLAALGKQGIQEFSGKLAAKMGGVPVEEAAFKQGADLIKGVQTMNKAVESTELKPSTFSLLNLKAKSEAVEDAVAALEKAKDKSAATKDLVKAAEKHYEAVNKIYEKAGVDNPHDPIDVGALSAMAGAKPGPIDHLVDKWHAKLDPTTVGAELGGAIGAGAGKMLPIPGGEFAGYHIGKKLLGPQMGGVIQSIVNKSAPAESIMKASSYIQRAMDGDNMLMQASKHVFNSGSSQGIDAIIKPISDDKLDKLDNQIKSMSGDTDAIAKTPGKIGEVSPEHAAGISAVTNGAIQYLNAQRPTNPQQYPFDAKLPTTQAQDTGYRRTLAVANQPLLVLKHIQNGTVLQQDVATVKTIYPQLYDKMSQHLIQNISDKQEKGETTPYRLRQSVSLFLDQPMDSTMTPASIMAAQPKPAQPPPQAPGGGKGPKKSTNGLSKVPKSYMTPNQGAEADRSSRD